jgi:hypothetical protein
MNGLIQIKLSLLQSIPKHGIEEIRLVITYSREKISQLSGSCFKREITAKHTEKTKPNTEELSIREI